ncbi:HEAT repeat domain-containing protein [Pyxidicoccus fallax]|uniref:HEAT repeat domain-containing protein n=1 Tax=Pyxidicoccus fallax TaxID=394095 RepID=A0A848LSJ8_9BACT|nr:HEAT repeat domain-containing protein [Pyxidicoccus fallax]NMO20661.1 HEAT repeat domain-containing protein [Pyxidicoccus fallax]NPC79020.1 HEAT repeat domain-containing protein [Pyxidicoccus fallax]
MKKVRVPMKHVQAAAQLGSMALMAGWSLESVTEATDTRPYQLVWVTDEEDEPSIIRFIDDFMIEVPYAYIESETPEHFVRVLREFVDVYSQEEIQKLADSAATAEQLQLAVRLMSLTAPPEFDAAFFEFFRKCLTFADAMVQRKAILAIGYVGWKELLPVLEQLAKGDPDSEVRDLARIALEGFAKHGTRN